MLFDGNPMYPAPGALWQLAQDAGVTLFGCSARYLQAVEDSGCVPGREYDLHKLRTVMSTGSPSTVNTFAFVYKSIKADVQFASISGGTDLNGCFALGSPMVPGLCKLASIVGVPLMPACDRDNAPPPCCSAITRAAGAWPRHEGAGVRCLWQAQCGCQGRAGRLVWPCNPAACMSKVG